MKKRMKLHYFLAVLLVLLLSVTACGTTEPNQDPPMDDPSVESPGQEPDENIDAEGPTEPEQPKAHIEKKNLSIYYTGMDLLNIVEEWHEIEYQSQQELLHGIWSALLNPTNEEFIPLWEGFVLNSIQLDEGLLTIDVALPEQPQLGSTGEAIAIQTLLLSFAGIGEVVQYIQLLIDGQKEESLAGHVSIDEPFSIDEVIYDG